jgi:hypothetical protein
MGIFATQIESIYINTHSDQFNHHFSIVYQFGRDAKLNTRVRTCIKLLNGIHANALMKTLNYVNIPLL